MYLWLCVQSIVGVVSVLVSHVHFCDIYTWADHLILGLIFFREIIIRSEMATEWDT